MKQKVFFKGLSLKQIKQFPLESESPTLGAKFIEDTSLALQYCMASKFEKLIF